MRSTALEQDGLIARVKGSGTYVSYAPEKNKEERPRIGLILSYFSDYLFPQVYEGIESVLREKAMRSVFQSRATGLTMTRLCISKRGCWGAMCPDSSSRGRVPVSRIRICGFTRRYGGEYSDAVYSQSLPE